MPIRVLDPALVGRIAAGEVVERPASAVKELVENAIDAGAAAITVEIKEGGIESLRVTDNGCGIEANQVAVAFQNHATSKLASPEQLDDIRTLGFRGEALPSIAAVTKVTMTTRTRGAKSGVRYTIDESGRRAEDAGCPEGTTIVARDLFYNVPVRRAFLKKPAYEAGLVTEVMARLILANPSVAVKYVNNGRVVYHSIGDGDLRHAAFAVYGRDVARQMTEIDESEGAFRVQGLIGIGELARASRAQQMFFINGRVVRCQAVQRALEAAVEGRIPRGSYPMCALALTVAPGSVDVNVHPNKLEVRFRDEEAVYAAALKLIGGALAGKSALQDMFDPGETPVTPVVNVTEIAPAPVETPVPAEAPALAPVKSSAPAEAPAPVQVGIPVPAESPAPAPVAPVREAPPRRTDFYDLLRQEKQKLGIPDADKMVAERREPLLSTPVPQGEILNARKPCRVVGSVFKTYILVETEDAMVMIDQHAAHERLQYEKFRLQLEQGSASQFLAVPLLVELSPREMAAISENLDTLRDTGYDVEPFGDTSVRVNAVPHLFGRAEMRPLFVELADQLGELKGAEIERRREEVMRFSCHRSVRAGDELTAMEINALIDLLSESETPPTCPHGRPIFKVFTRREVERMFGRIK